MKISTMIIFLIILTLTLTLFENIGTVKPDSGDLDWFNQSSFNDDRVQNSSDTSALIDFIKHPQRWNDNILFYLVVTVGAVLTGFGFAALVTKSYAPDTYIFAFWFGTLVGFGSLPVYQTFTFLQKELSSFMCLPGPGGIIQFCMMPTLIAILIASSIGLTWIFVCINHWRTGSQ